MLVLEKVKVTLISGRTTKQGMGLEVGKTSNEYFESVSYIELSKIDGERLDIAEDDVVEVKTQHGTINVSSRLSDDLESGIAFIPYGPWANRLFGSFTDGTGMPSFKGINAEIYSAIGENIPTLENLVNLLRGK